MSSAFLLAAVLLVMLAGMLLKTDSAGRSSGGTPVGIRRSVASVGRGGAPRARPDTDTDRAPTRQLPPEPDPQPAAIVDPLLLKLASRAEADCGRLAKVQARWTAQLLVACKPETVERTAARRARNEPSLRAPRPSQRRRLFPRLLRVVRDLGRRGEGGRSSPGASRQGENRRRRDRARSSREASASLRDRRRSPAPSPASRADVLHLQGGGTIDADRWWIEGETLHDRIRRRRGRAPAHDARPGRADGPEARGARRRERQRLKDGRRAEIPSTCRRRPRGTSFPRSRRR